MLRIMSYPISILKNIIGGSMDFSLDEKKVGTWIDGKPVYQKTFNFVSNNGLKLTSTNDIKAIVMESGYMESVSILPYYGVLSANVDSTNNIYVSTNGTNGKNCYLTIWYTKTTD